ncbi:MAG: CoA transferase [Chloroflexi bacterium]|nr:CoA transferase [Chloroflexota bacterium]
MTRDGSGSGAQTAVDHGRPLAGYRVLDLSRALAGPHCTGLLADMGADVIKVEDVRGGDETRLWGPPFLGVDSAYFLSVNRSRRSVAVDLKNPDGLRICLELAKQADVVVENFRPGVVARLGLDYASVKAINPGVVYASISAYGQDGSGSQEPGYDLIVQGTGGLMSVTGDPDGGPMKAGVAEADILAGTNAAVAIVGALLGRERKRASGDAMAEGTFLDVALFDGQVSLMGYHLVSYQVSGRVPGRSGNRFPFIVPYQAFGASDGDFTLAVPNERLWLSFTAVIERPDLASDPRYADNGLRVRNRDTLTTDLASVLATRTVAEWVSRFRDAGIPCGPISDIGQVASSRYVAERGLLHEIEHPAGAVRIPGQPWRTGETHSRAASAPPGRPPRHGEHTEGILGELGYDTVAIKQLEHAGVIRTDPSDEM